MTKEERKKYLEDRKQEYYKLRLDLECWYMKLSRMEKYRGNSTAFKQLLLSISLMQEQCRADHERILASIARVNQRKEMADLQNSLNRERTKREALEKQIKDASESSGLFIKYVRSKLNI